MSRGRARGRVWRGGLRSFRSPPSRGVGGNRRRRDGKGRDAPPVALHLGHGQAPLKKKRAGARPKRAAAGVPLRESLAVFRWRTPADREIAVVAAILPSCRARGKGNPLSRTSAPRSFRKSGPFPAEKHGIGAWPPPAYVPGTPTEILRGPARPREARRGIGPARTARERCPLPATSQKRGQNSGRNILSPACGFAN